MSRCFPFPPPGYEKKSRIADEGLLAKEKHKEKRHKKEKKEKEKREPKEKKNKDSHREKHREKKKEKDRERDKEKNRSSDAEENKSQKGIYNGEKLDPSSSHSYEVKDSEHVQELVRRTRDQNGASGSQMFLAATDDRRARMRDTSSESSVDRIPEKVKAKVKTENLCRGNVTDMSLKSSVDKKDKVTDEKGDHGKANGQGNQAIARAMEKKSLQISSPLDQKRCEPTLKALGKVDADKQMEGKERKEHKERRQKDGKEKHKDKDRGKDKTSKDKDRYKEEKSEEKVKENRELSREQPKLKESDPKLKQSSKDPLDFRIIKPSDSSKLSNTSLAGDVNSGKRKGLEMDGFLLDEGSSSKKSARLDSLSPLVVENGSKLEPSHNAIQFKPHGLPTNGHGVETEDIKINGFITPQRLNESSEKPLPGHGTKNVNGEESVKSKAPHPDIKYLSQILSVPTMEDFSDSLEEEWLFGGNNLKSNNLNMGSADDQMHQVWSETIWIESANISALPYVVPY